MASVSIVIRALNEAEHLPALFSGLLRQTRRPDQVILVDSGSVDDTVAIAQAHGAEVVHISPSRVLVRAGAEPRLCPGERRPAGDRQRPRLPTGREVARPAGGAVRAPRGRRSSTAVRPVTAAATSPRSSCCASGSPTSATTTSRPRSATTPTAPCAPRRGGHSPTTRR